MPTRRSNSTARACAASRAGAAMLLERLGDLPLDRQHRVQRRHRLLKDHADLAAADLAHLLLGQLQQVAAVEPDFAPGDPSRRVRDQPQHRHRGDRFAGPAFADHRHGLAGIHRIRDAVDRAYDTGAGAKLGMKVPDFEKRRQSGISSRSLYLGPVGSERDGPSQRQRHRVVSQKAAASAYHRKTDRRPLNKSCNLIGRPTPKV